MRGGSSHPPVNTRSILYIIIIKQRVSLSMFSYNIDPTTGLYYDTDTDRDTHTHTHTTERHNHTTWPKAKILLPPHEAAMGPVVRPTPPDGPPTARNASAHLVQTLEIGREPLVRLGRPFLAYLSDTLAEQGPNAVLLDVVFAVLDGG